MPASVRAKRFWKRCIGSWGAQMAEQFGTTIPDDWAIVVDRVDDERLDRAFLRLRQETPIYAPKLGQLEHAIPNKLFGEDSIPDRLAQAAVKQFGPILCEHQLWRPWSYFGRNVSSEGRAYQETVGVVIPACPDGCGKAGHRLTVEELGA